MNGFSRAGPNHSGLHLRACGFLAVAIEVELEKGGRQGFHRMIGQ